jgi:hypothetical protein
MKTYAVVHRTLLPHYSPRVARATVMQRNARLYNQQPITSGLLITRSCIDIAVGYRHTPHAYCIHSDIIGQLCHFKPYAIWHSSVHVPGLSLDVSFAGLCSS